MAKVHTSEPKPCNFEGCDRQARSLGLCNGHYQQLKAKRPLTPLRTAGQPIKMCTFPGCEHQVLCSALCDGHYQQQRAGKTLVPLQKIHTVCTFVGCTEPHEAKGYCVAHYDQYKDGKDMRPLAYLPSPIEIKGEYAEVTLYGKDENGRVGDVVGYARIDKADIPEVSQHRWRTNHAGYPTTKIDQKHIFMHRFLLKPPEDLQIDHIDGNPLNNTRENLRIVTYEQNMQNKKPWGQSGHRNVFLDEVKSLYRVLVQKDGVKHSGGRHKSLEKAIEAATKLRSELFTHHNEDRTTREDE